MSLVAQSSKKVLSRPWSPPSNEPVSEACAMRACRKKKRLEASFSGSCEKSSTKRPFTATKKKHVGRLRVQIPVPNYGQLEPKRQINSFLSLDCIY